MRKLLARLVCTCTPDALCLSSGMCLWEQFNHWPTQPLPQKSDPDNPLSLLHCVRVCSSLYYLASSIYFLSLPKICLNLFFKLDSHKILLFLTTDYSMCWLKHTHTHYTNTDSHSYTSTHADCILIVIHEPWHGNKIKLHTFHTYGQRRGGIFYSFLLNSRLLQVIKILNWHAKLVF